jgi:hypothetical protein
MKQQLWFPYTLNHCTNLRNLKKNNPGVKGGQGGELTPPIGIDTSAPTSGI